MTAKYFIPTYLTASSATESFEWTLARALNR